MSAGAPHVAVVGPGDAGDDLVRVAEEVGRGLAEAGAVVVCGGLGGVMAAACRGAAAAGGTSIGILPGSDRSAANPWVTVAVATGLGEARNAVVAATADALVAVGGEWGTLSEVALAAKAGTPVVGLGTWQLRRPGDRDVPELVVATSAADAVRVAVAAATRRSSA